MSAQTHACSCPFGLISVGVQYLSMFQGTVLKSVDARMLTGPTARVWRRRWVFHVTTDRRSNALRRSHIIPADNFTCTTSNRSTDYQSFFGKCARSRTVIGSHCSPATVLVRALRQCLCASVRSKLTKVQDWLHVQLISVEHSLLPALQTAPAADTGLTRLQVRIMGPHGTQPGIVCPGEELARTVCGPQQCLPTSAQLLGTCKLVFALAFGVRRAVRNAVLQCGIVLQ
jgi:hypothetical protein